jgi:hypothetical protein
VYKCFVNLSPGEQGDGGCKTGREFRLHGRQISYYARMCETTSADPTFPISLWHERLFNGLVTSRRGQDLGGAAPKKSPITPAPHASQNYVEAFSEASSVSEEYWLSHFVRHICGMPDGVMVAKDVVTDYRGRGHDASCCRAYSFRCLKMSATPSGICLPPPQAAFIHS